MNISDTKKRIEKVKGSFAVDGMQIDEDQEEMLKRCISGKITHEEAIQEITAKYRNDRLMTKAQ